MFQPKLGTCLGCIWTNELTHELIEAVEQSRIATLEMNPKLFEVEDREAKTAALKAMLDRRGIPVTTVHALSAGANGLASLDDSLQDALNAVRVALDLAAEFGAKAVVVHAGVGAADPEERRRLLDQARRSLEVIGEQCVKAGKRVAVERLPRMSLGNSVDELLQLLDGLDENVFGVCMDTNHLMDRPHALPDEVRRLGHRLTATHLSDYDGVDEKHELPGTGVVDWGAFMAALADIGYSGGLTYECRIPGDTLAERIQALEENFDWLCSL